MALPDGIMVPRFSADPNADFSRSAFTHEVRLNRGNTGAMSPTGAYECRVPPLGGGALVTASITITNGIRSMVFTQSQIQGVGRGPSIKVKCSSVSS